MTICADLLTLPPDGRREFLDELDKDDVARILAQFRTEMGSPYALWRDDPVGFIQDVLGEYVWSKQADIARAIRANRRVAVPASHSPGKTHLAARLIAWWASVHEPGSAMAVTTATTGGQVRKLLWPHIRRVVIRNQLPGVKQCNQIEWRIDENVVAFGFSPNKYDEAAGQGIHAEHLLVVVDEAGGIAPLLGDNLDSLMTGEDSHILAVGNPPTEDEGGWFETVCQSGLWNTIPISAFSTPNFTGEPCPRQVAKQLVDKRWVQEIAEHHGIESAYYIARVLAQFPKVSASRAIPVAWCEAAMENDEPAKTDWQRLGVDVADGGGDEMVVAHADGWNVRVVQTWAGADTADQVVNAERVLEWILYAEGIQRKRGYTERKVRVKIDTIGVGAGTGDILTRMGRDGKHNADIVHVSVSESPAKENAAEFRTRRDECWWTMREACRDGTIRLIIDEKQKAQLVGPLYGTDTAGRIVVESKKDMKKRGLKSPDTADAMNLAIYEPVSVAESQSYGHQVAQAKIPRSVGRTRT